MTYPAVNLLIAALLAYVAFYKYRSIFGLMWQIIMPHTKLIEWVYSGTHGVMASYTPHATEYFRPFMIWLLIMRSLILMIPAIILHYSQPALFKRLRDGEWR